MGKRKINTIKELYLTDNQSISDQGVKYISRLNLRKLGLSGTSITDVGLGYLQSMSN